MGRWGDLTECTQLPLILLRFSRLRGAGVPGCDHGVVSNMTGRALVERGLKERLGDAGWAPRGAGWFTKALGDEWLAVLAVAAATRQLPSGHAMATVHVSVRNEPIEAQVANICGFRTDYRTRTVVTSIGYLMPQQRWTEWLISSETVGLATNQMVEAIELYTPPWFARMTGDRGAFLTETQRPSRRASCVEMDRHVLTLSRFAGAEAAAAELADLEQDLIVRNHGLAYESKRLALDALKARTPAWQPTHGFAARRAKSSGVS